VVNDTIFNFALLDAIFHDRRGGPVDPDPDREANQCCRSGIGIRFFFYPWIRDPDPGVGKIQMTIPDHNFESIVKNFWVKNTYIL
jgi:hypothetical protein